MLTASQTEDTINISWKAPINLEECDITYNINVDNISYTSLDTFIDIENIIPCKNYSITVTPTIENEIGPPTSKIITASSRSKFSKRKTQLLFQYFNFRNSFTNITCI